MKRSPVYTPNLSHLKKLAQVIFIFTCSGHEKTTKLSWGRIRGKLPGCVVEIEDHIRDVLKTFMFVQTKFLKKRKKKYKPYTYLCIYTYTYVEQKHLLESPPPLKALLKH